MYIFSFFLCCDILTEPFRWRIPWPDEESLNMMKPLTWWSPDSSEVRDASSVAYTATITRPHWPQPHLTSPKRRHWLMGRTALFFCSHSILFVIMWRADNGKNNGRRKFARPHFIIFPWSDQIWCLHSRWCQPGLVSHVKEKPFASPLQNIILLNPVLNCVSLFEKKNNIT